MDAIASYSASGDTAVAIVTREEATGDRYQLRFRDLIATRTYRVRFETFTARYVMTGEQLMNLGVEVPLPESRSAEIVYLEPAGM